MLHGWGFFVEMSLFSRVKEEMGPYIIQSELILESERRIQWKKRGKKIRHNIYAKPHFHNTIISVIADFFCLSSVNSSYAVLPKEITYVS